MRWSSAWPTRCDAIAAPVATTRLDHHLARSTIGRTMSNSGNHNHKSSKLQLGGAMTAMVTPFCDGRVDEGRLREQIEYQIGGGIDGLVPVGTTGESPTLDFDEHERVIELTVDVVNGRVPVIAGVGGNATTEALELHNFAKKVGATA